MPAGVKAEGLRVEYLGVPIAVVTMLLAQRVERRLGAAAAGWIAALPISMTVAGATVAVTQSPADASGIALSAAGHVGPMMAYAVVFVLAAVRIGAIWGVVAAAVVYAVASLAVMSIASPIRIGLGFVAIALATVFMSRQPRASATGQVASTVQQIMALASAATIVGLITFTNQLAGPDLAGAIGAFPTMSTTIALFVAHRSGPRRACSVMSGLVRSIPVYVTYCLAFAFLVTRTSTLWALAAATCLALVVAMLTWRTVERNVPVEEGAIFAEP